MLRRRHSGDNDLADFFAWLEKKHSDAGEYLLTLVDSRYRLGDVLSTAFDIRDQVERLGQWEQTNEWRIGTPGTDRIQTTEADRFHVTTEYHGRFTATFATFVQAYEAMRALARLQMDLFWALGWSSWAGPGRLRPTDPDHGRTEKHDEYPYLLRLSREARGEGEVLAKNLAKGAASRRGWSERVRRARLTIIRRAAVEEREAYDGRKESVFVFTVSTDSLEMESESATAERAAEFIGVYTRLQPDLRAILRWEWL